MPTLPKEGTVAPCGMLLAVGLPPKSRVWAPHPTLEGLWHPTDLGKAPV